MPEQRHGARGDASPLVLPTFFGITNAQARDVGAAAVVQRRGQSVTQAEWVYSPIAPGSAKLVTNRSEPDTSQPRGREPKIRRRRLISPFAGQGPSSQQNSPADH